MGKIIPILVLLLVPLCSWAIEPSVFQGLKGMLPAEIVKDLEALKADDLAAAKRIFKNMNKSDNLTAVAVKESPLLFNFVRDTVHALRAKKDAAFAQFIPETNAFVTKLQAILENAIEETSALYTLEKPEVKENLRAIFPQAMFTIEHPTFKNDLITLCCCCQERSRHHHHGGGGGGGGGLLGFLFG